jgi:dihydrofolate reductase
MDVIGIVAISLDGCITRHGDEGVTFTSDADKRFFRHALTAFDCSVFGSGTFRASQEAILAAAAADDHLRVVLTRTPAQYAQYERPGHLEFKAGDLGAILDGLAARGKARCAMLGGGRWYTECARRGLMQELWVTIEPVGLGSGKRLFEGEVDLRFAVQRVEHLSADTLLVKYRVS